MATRNLTANIQVRQDTATNWNNKNPVLKSGEIGYDTTNKITKIGDGVTPWKTLKAFQIAEPPVIYGVRISRTNSNPATAVEYIDDASGFTAATPTNAGSWTDRFPYNAIKPCLLKNGTVVGYLNPNNYAQFASGGAADITSGNAGDVMIEFPKIYYQISQDTTYTYIRISNTKFEGFTDLAHSYKGVVRDRFYIGAYKGFKNGSNLRSLSGKIPTVEQTIGQFRTSAQANGDGYELLSFNKLTLLQALFVIRFKSINSQTALGKGYTEDGDYEYNVSTGATNSNGLYYGSTSDGKVHVKVHGIEDFWGFIFEWIDGIGTNTNAIYTADGNFNDALTGYTNRGTQASTSGWIKDIKGTNELGFVIATGSGSDTTYYSDYGSADVWSGVYVAFFGGSWGSESYAGAFYLYVYYTPSDADDYIGGRLCFCG